MTIDGFWTYFYCLENCLITKSTLSILYWCGHGGLDQVWGLNPLKSSVPTHNHQFARDRAQIPIWGTATYFWVFGHHDRHDHRDFNDRHGLYNLDQDAATTGPGPFSTGTWVSGLNSHHRHHHHQHCTHHHHHLCYHHQHHHHHHVSWRKKLFSWA